MNPNGDTPAQHVQAQPSPVTFGLARVPTPDGTDVYVLELHGVTGVFVAFFNRESLLSLADQARELGTGLTIARGAIPPSPEGLA